ncbi:hypothetical protein HaLaN_03874 [Haematococcus lacustris]|uniref:Uncharacterized protein n=1 Tax=Haematococcus lacustris TaxID=44745 RepID=A0A699YFL5_HAELA|nr:hypothetical protein HaLaN_03874 [Haematococcus lacustris]
MQGACPMVSRAQPLQHQKDEHSMDLEIAIRHGLQLAGQGATPKLSDRERLQQTTSVALYRCKLASNKLPPTTSKLLKNQLQELWAVVGNGQPTVKPVRNMHIADWLDVLAVHMSPVTN